MIGKRDAENARLRDQREQQAAELNERKQKDSVKLASMKELESLAEARSASRASFRRVAILICILGSHRCVGVSTKPTQGPVGCQRRQRGPDALFLLRSAK